MDRHRLDRSEASVDSTHRFVDGGAQVLILFHILTRGYCYLNQHHFADPLRMILQERLESVQLLRYTFDVIQSIDTDDDLDTFESTLQTLDPFLDAFAFQTVLEL